MKVHEVFGDSEFENKEDEELHLKALLKDLRSRIYHSEPGTDKLERLVIRARAVRNKLLNMGIRENFDEISYKDDEDQLQNIKERIHSLIMRRDMATVWHKKDALTTKITLLQQEAQLLYNKMMNQDDTP